MTVKAVSCDKEIESLEQIFGDMESSIAALEALRSRNGQKQKGR